MVDLLDKYMVHKSVTTDTRKIKQGDLFFALRGPSFNGNQFAEKALKSGASYAIVDDPGVVKSDRYVLVDDVLIALQSLAREYRKTFSCPVLAITGSNGKTTTKELAASVLSLKYNVHYTQGNFNNHIGVPLTLLSASQDADFLIIEMGANHLKEIELLCEIALPDYGIITNIGEAHIEGFGSYEGVKRGKSELYKFLSRNNNTIFVNTDDPVLVSLLKGNNHIEGYSAEEHMAIDGSPLLRYKYRGGTIIETKLFGLYNRYNVAAASAIGLFFGLEQKMIDQAIAGYEPSNNRSELISIDGNDFILDAYNSNPSSLKASLKSVIASGFNNLHLVLGDMLELGEMSDKAHQNILDWLLANTADCKVILVGELFFKFKDNYNFKFFSNVLEAKNELFGVPIHNQTYFLKGSRGIALEKIISL